MHMFISNFLSFSYNVEKDKVDKDVDTPEIKGNNIDS